MCVWKLTNAKHAQCMLTDSSSLDHKMISVRKVHLVAILSLSKLSVLIGSLNLKQS